jgi:hypothetical protein
MGPGKAASASPTTRPFYMGFTRWPSDLTLDGFTTAQDFAHAHGDIVSVMFIGGVPWPESLSGQPYSKDVQTNLNYRPPAGKKLFLSISILDQDRRNLAPYRGEKDNLPLPKPWDTLAINSPEVKKAYLAFTLRAVKAMKPDYLAIGIELNVLLSHDPVKWKQLKERYRETYQAVKAKYPNLPVFFTTEALHYKKLASNVREKAQAGARYLGCLSESPLHSKMLHNRSAGASGMAPSLRPSATSLPRGGGCRFHLS